MSKRAVMDLHAALRFYYLFDIADTIDLASLRTVGGEGVTKAPLAFRALSTPGYIQFPTPPLTARLGERPYGSRTVAARVKLFDYGVVSVRLSIAHEGSLDALIELAAELRGDEGLANLARELMEPVARDIAFALDDPHEALVEDYLVVEIRELQGERSAQELLRTHGAELARLALNERGKLSASEVTEALRTTFSYFDDDLTIVQWDTAIVYDRAESAETIEDILEFANSQLLELRTYDAQLDHELDAIYAAKPGRTVRSFFGRRAAEQAATLRYLIVDVLELSDRASNALKIIGDAYYARIYRAAAARLGLKDWQKQVDSKLTSVGDIYRFLNDQASSARDAFMEIIIIVLIAVEVVIGVFSLHR